MVFGISILMCNIMIFLFSECIGITKLHVQRLWDEAKLGLISYKRRIPLLLLLWKICMHIVSLQPDACSTFCNCNKVRLGNAKLVTLLLKFPDANIDFFLYFWIGGISRNTRYQTLHMASYLDFRRIHFLLLKSSIRHFCKKCLSLKRHWNYENKHAKSQNISQAAGLQKRLYEKNIIKSVSSR